MTSIDFKQHLQEEHHQTGFSEYLKEVIYGGNDGIVTTFAVVAGFGGAMSHASVETIGTLAVIIFGLANLLADAASMGLGNFLSLRSEADLYYSQRKKEAYEIKHKTEFEYKETIDILQHRGISSGDAKQFADLYRKNPEFWIDFMMDYELKIPDPRGENPLVNGLMTFLSFLFFGSIPLLPYFLLPPNDTAFHISIGTTLSALTLLGTLRWWVTRESWRRCTGETVLVGGVCAVLAYSVGWILV